MESRWNRNDRGRLAEELREGLREPQREWEALRSEDENGEGVAAKIGNARGKG